MNWRDALLQAFTPQVARFTIVSDPDGLLLEETLGQAIRARGFDIQVYENSIQFRYLYETYYRPRWEANETLELVLIVPDDEHFVDRLPYDWLTQAHKLHFNLSELFPNLNYAMVATLDRSLLDSLYQAQSVQHTGKLGEQATLDFILRYVFEIIPEIIRQPEDLLHFLLRRHYNRLPLSPLIDDYLVRVLTQKPAFTGWPLAEIIPDRQAFLSFLQERWPFYLQSLADGKDIALKEPASEYTLSIAGPNLLPFGHEDVRVYIDSFFIEGMLKPVENFHFPTGFISWATVGTSQNESTDRTHRFERLLEKLERDFPGPDQHHTVWSAFALRWAEYSYLWHGLAEREKEKYHAAYERLQSKTGIQFQAWLHKRYSSLTTLPGTVMVHHIIRQMRNEIEKTALTAKVALLVVDGLALDQWVELRRVLIEQHSDIDMSESTVFAWIPTLTSVSRQAIFSGRAPFYFAASIQTTEKESTLWSQFWVEAGFQPAQIAYLRRLGEPGSLEKVSDLLASHSPRVLGLVVDTVDKIIHGMQLGSPGMHNQVYQWAQQGFLAKLITILGQSGYTIYLTSDHGNIEAVGCGKPNEGASADLRGERVRIYPNIELLTKTQLSFPGSITWIPVGLPPNYFPLIAPDRQAFISYGEKTVAHGGIAIEEVIVPFVQLKIRKA